MVFLVGGALAKVLPLNFSEKIKSCPDLSRFSVIKWYCESFFTAFLNKDLGYRLAFSRAKVLVILSELCARLACRGSRRASEYRRSAFI